MSLIYEILLKSQNKAEYFFPKQINPKVILDIGGNIGITSIFLAKVFPNASIYTFEPLKENFELLEKNIQNYPNIKAFNVGLGSKNGSFKVYFSDDPENLLAEDFVIYSQKHQIVTGTNIIELKVKEKPLFAGVDPYVKLVDKDNVNNLAKF